MRVSIEYSLLRTYNNVLVTATVSKLVKEIKEKKTDRMDFDMAKWIIFPEWIEQGLFLQKLDLENFTAGQPYQFTDHFEVEKDFTRDIWIFTPITPDRKENTESLTIETSRVRLATGFGNLIKKQDFTFSELVRKKELEKPVKRVQKKSKFTHAVYSDCDEI